MFFAVHVVPNLVYTCLNFLVSFCLPTCWKRASALRDFRKPIRVSFFIRIFFSGRVSIGTSRPVRFRYANENTCLGRPPTANGVMPCTQQVFTVLISVVRRDKSCGDRARSRGFIPRYIIAF